MRAAAAKRTWNLPASDLCRWMHEVTGKSGSTLDVFGKFVGLYFGSTASYSGTVGIAGEIFEDDHLSGFLRSSYFWPASHAKFAASLVSPLPLYFAD